MVIKDEVTGEVGWDGTAGADLSGAAFPKPPPLAAVIHWLKAGLAEPAMPAWIPTPPGLPLRRLPADPLPIAGLSNGDVLAIAKVRVHAERESLQLFQLALAGVPDGSIATSLRELPASGDR
jgi:hypothetical protein